MENVLIVIHLLVVIALVVVVLLQRSEGGGLGIGGGGGMMSARSAGDALTRLTQILGAAFFVTSISLGLIGRYGDNPTNILNRIPLNAESESTVPTEGGVLDQLGGAETPAAPEAPAVPTVPNN